MKGNKITIVDDPETMRVRKTQEQVSQANYHGHASKAEMMERNRLLIDSGTPALVSHNLKRKRNCAVI